MLRKNLWQHRHAILAKAWVEVEDKAHRPGLRGQGHVYVIVPQAEHVDQPDMQGTFSLLHLLTKILLKFGCITFIIVASCMIDLGLEVETSRKSVIWEFSPRT